MLDDERVWDAPIDLAELTGLVSRAGRPRVTEGEWKLLAPGRPYRELRLTCGFAPSATGAQRLRRRVSLVHHLGEHPHQEAVR